MNDPVISRGFFGRQSRQAVVRWFFGLSFWATFFYLLLCLFVYWQTQIDEILAGCEQGLGVIIVVAIFYWVLRLSRPEAIPHLLLSFIAVGISLVERSWSGITFLTLGGGVTGLLLVARLVLPGRRVFPAGVIILFSLTIWLINLNSEQFRLPINQQPILQALIPLQLVFVFIVGLLELIYQFEFYTIRDRLWAFLTFNTLMAIALITVALALISWQQELDQSVNQLETVATFKESQMNNWLDQAQLLLNVPLPQSDISCLLVEIIPPCQPEAYESLLAQLQVMLESSNHFDEFFVMDRYGIVLISTRPEQEGKIFANRPFFTAGLIGEHIESPIYDPVLERVSVILSRPIVTNDGSLLGVVAGRANMNQINQIILDPKQFQLTSNTYLLNTNSIALTRPAGIQIENLTNLYIHSAGTQHVLESRANGYALYNDYQNTPVIGVYHWLDQLQIALITEQYQQEAFANAYQTITTNLIIAIIAVLADIPITLFIARTITTPINNLAHTATSIATGNLLLTANVNSKDEIGNLALSFNSMTNQLRTVIGDLEQRFHELQQAQEKVRQSEEYQRALIEQTSDAIIITNANGLIRFVSPAIQRILNYCPEEMVGHSAVEFVHPADLEATADNLRQLLNSRGEVVSLELRVRHRDESWRIMELVGRNLLHDSIVQGLVINGRDISERKRVEEALLQTQKLESIGLLAGGVAHDFNNLLTSLMAQTSLALLKLDPLHPARLHIERAITSTHRATDLTRQLLAYAGKGRFEIQLIDLNHLIVENVGLFETALSRRIMLETKLERHLPMIEGDRGQIQQVVMNLVINAGEAIVGDSGRVIITTYAQTVTAGDPPIMLLPGRDTPLQPGPYVGLEISDTGLGMDKETIERIFDPFFSTKGNGRGLGLSATLGIIGSHKGSLTVQSQPGQGTTFRILFPAANPNEPLPNPPALETPPKPPPPHQPTVLVIDDELPVREAVSDILEVEGISVLSAANGLEGLTLFQAKQNEIDLILLDMQMPMMNGEQTLKALRQINPHVKIILSSGYSENDLISRIGDDELTTFLQKPYQIDKLIAKIGQILF